MKLVVDRKLRQFEYTIQREQALVNDDKNAYIFGQRIRGFLVLYTPKIA